jgi:hypothetical protein
VADCAHGLSSGVGMHAHESVFSGRGAAARTRPS